MVVIGLLMIGLGVFLFVICVKAIIKYKSSKSNVEKVIDEEIKKGK